MIAYLEGKIIKKESDRILLIVHGVGYEILLPAYVMSTAGPVGSDDICSYYIYYHQTERQPKPVLIGFNLEAEKEFFQQFISVDAIGPMKAVKAMEIPARDIARAIEEKNTDILKGLKGLGLRTAEKVIASLHGKMGKFALINQGTTQQMDPEQPTGDFVEQVVEVLILQLGYKPLEAKKMVREAMARNKNLSTPEDLFDEVYRGAQVNDI